MISYNLERFANSPGNLEHVTLYFDNLVDKNGTLSKISHGIFLLHCEYMCVQVESFKLKLVHPEKKIKGLWCADVQECQPWCKSSILCAFVSSMYTANFFSTTWLYCRVAVNVTLTSRCWKPFWTYQYGHRNNVTTPSPYYTRLTLQRHCMGNAVAV